MHSRNLIFPIIFALMTGCGFESDRDLKFGYIGMSSEDQELMKKLAAVLDEQELEAYSYDHDGEIWIAYREADQEQIDHLISVITHPGGRPFNHDGYCSSDKKSAQELVKTLDQHSIPTVLKEDERIDCDACYCVYWPIDKNDQVETLDPVFRQMRSHQEEMGDDI
jgi:hypothetical protein